jgi:hypothetical protein
MRAIAPKVSGLLLLVAAPLFCSEPVDAIAELASALSQNNSVNALQVFDSKMQGYSSIESNIEALVAQTDILCAIDIVDEKETAAGRELDVDWYMQLKSQLPNGPTERRRERVILGMKLVRGQWKIASLSSARIIAPITLP